jgi:hypothetical protein
MLDLQKSLLASRLHDVDCLTASLSEREFKMCFCWHDAECRVWRIQEDLLRVTFHRTEIDGPLRLSRLHLLLSIAGAAIAVDDRLPSNDANPTSDPDNVTVTRAMTPTSNLAYGGGPARDRSPCGDKTPSRIDREVTASCLFNGSYSHSRAVKRTCWRQSIRKRS